MIKGTTHQKIWQTYVHIKWQSLKENEAKTDKRKNRQIHNYSWKYRNTTLSLIGRTIRQKISNHIEELDNKINQKDRILMYITFHPTEYTFISSTHGNGHQERPQPGSWNTCQLREWILYRIKLKSHWQ